MDDQSHGLPKLEQLVFVISCQNYTVLLPSRARRLFGNLTLKTKLPLLLSNCILQRPQEHCWAFWDTLQVSLCVVIIAIYVSEKFKQLLLSLTFDL